MQTSVSDNLRLSVQSVYEDVKVPCAAGDIKVLADIRGVLLLTRQGVQAITERRCSHAAPPAGFRKKNGALRRVSIVEAKKDGALKRAAPLESSVEEKGAEVQVVQTEMEGHEGNETLFSEKWGVATVRFSVLSQPF